MNPFLPVFVFQIGQLGREFVLRLRVRSQAASQVVVVSGQVLAFVLVVTDLKKSIAHNDKLTQFSRFVYAHVSLFYFSRKTRHIRPPPTKGQLLLQYSEIVPFSIATDDKNKRLMILIPKPQNGMKNKTIFFSSQENGFFNRDIVLQFSFQG